MGDYVWKKIAVLIPCYNESVTIEKVVRDFRAALPDADIYVYDNNSADNTAEIAKNAGAVVRHEYRQGKGNVIRTMFRDIDADCYIMTDGDDTYPAEYAREMAELVLNGRADMVIGDRLSATYFEENKRPFHGFGNSLVRGFINTFWARGKKAKKILDVMTGYRTFCISYTNSPKRNLVTRLRIRFVYAGNFFIHRYAALQKFCTRAVLFLADNFNGRAFCNVLEKIGIVFQKKEFYLASFWEFYSVGFTTWKKTAYGF